MQLAIFIFLSFRDYFDLQSSERSIEVPLGGVFYVLFFASALCGVPSIIRAYFVAVFQTARHIINVGARTATYNQLDYLFWQITEKTWMKYKYR